jgi:hypothetical protein
MSSYNSLERLFYRRGCLKKRLWQVKHKILIYNLAAFMGKYLFGQPHLHWPPFLILYRKPQSYLKAQAKYMLYH